MADGTWTAAEAKAKFAQLMDRARTEGPQRVTKNGREAVVVVSEKDWAYKSQPRKSAADVLLDPRYRGLLTDEEMKVFERDQDPGRPIEF